MKILVIEDEKNLLESIIEYFSKEQYTCETASNYQKGLEKITIYQYDCILLDIGLPDGDGLMLLETLKSQRKMDGVIIISAKDSLDDKIKGLDMGADDYLTKPFHLSELNARVKSVIRRKHFEANDLVEVGNLSIDLMNHRVQCQNQKLELTKKEYDIFVYLAANKKRVVSKSSLAEHIWGDNIDQVDSFDFIFAHIKNLKKKLKTVEAGIDIKNIYGVGYQLIEV